MALAMECDRCKKLFKPNISCGGYINAHHNVLVTIDYKDKALDRLGKFDLCPECYEELKMWIKLEEVLKNP